MAHRGRPVPGRFGMEGQLRVIPADFAQRGEDPRVDQPAAVGGHPALHRQPD